MLKLLPKVKINLTTNFLLDNLNYISSTPSIIKDPLSINQYIVMLRCNFRVKGGSKSVNLIVYLDKNFNIINKKLINYNFKENNREGIEDIKLFNYNNNIYYIGTYKNSTIDKITSDKFDFPNIINVLTENIINVTFPTNYIIEKNWVFFNYKSKLCLIYRWFPLQICEIDYTSNKLILLEEKIMPIHFKVIRGSSCGVFYDNLVWFIVHYQYKTIKYCKTRRYLHMFVVFNENMELIKYSQYFIFESNIEFSYGLLIENDKFIITYSTNDSTSNISIFDYSYIKNNIKWTIL